MPKLARLIATLAALRRPPTVKNLKRILSGLPLEMADVAAHIRFDTRTYRRNIIDRSPGFEVKLLCWMGGQCSPIHDHSGSACAVQVVSGVATETTYDVSDPTRPRPETSHRLHAGSVTASFDRDAHRITAADGDLVTLHVYAPKLVAMVVYPDESP